MSDIRIVYIGNNLMVMHGLTIGKWYNGEIVSDGLYLVRNDNKFTDLYLRSLFKTLEEIRDEKILTVLDNE